MKARSAEIQQHVIKSIEEKERRKQKEREEAIELARYTRTFTHTDTCTHNSTPMPCGSHILCAHRRYAEELERKERERLAKIEEQQAKIKRQPAAQPPPPTHKWMPVCDCRLSCVAIHPWCLQDS